MNRRHFLKNGLWVPFVPNIIVRAATPIPHNPRIRTVVAGGGGGTCPADGSPSEVYAPTVNSDQHFGLNTDHYYAGLKGWLNASAKTICKLRFNLEAVGVITGITYRAAVYTLSGNNLNTELGFGTITGAAWTDSPVIIDFGVNVAAYPGSSTPVALVMSRNDNPNVSGTNYVKMNARDTDASFTPGSFATWNSSKVIEYDAGSTVDPVIGIYYY